MPDISCIQEAAAIVDPKNWVQLMDTDEVPKRRLASIYRAPTPEMICYLDFSVSTTGMLAGVKVSSTKSLFRCKIDFTPETGQI